MTASPPSLTLVGALLAAALPAQKAAACVNETERARTAKARLVEARTLHDEGRYAASARAVRDVPPFALLFDREVRAHAYELLALAAIRSEGAVDPNLVSFASRIDDDERQGQVRAAVAHLRERLATDRKDVLELQAAVAEGLVHLGELKEAGRILEPLADADLVPHPKTWAAIATLRAERGDAAGADAATKRCAATAGDDDEGRLCPSFPARS